MRISGSQHVDRQRLHPAGRPRSAPNGRTDSTVATDLGQHQSIVDRHRLHNLLDDAERLSLVVAPSGYGKTRLVQSWVARRAAAGDTVAWMQPEAGVEDIASFGRALRRELVSIGAVPADTGDTAGAPELWETWSPGSGWVETERLLAARTETDPRLIIVVDRGERLSSARLWDALERLTRRARRVSLVALIRTDRLDAGLPDAMRRDPHALTIGPAQLLFDLNEIASLADALGEVTTPVMARAALETTGGCPWLVDAVLRHWRDTGERVVDASMIRDSVAVGARVQRLVEQLSPVAPLALLDRFGIDELRLCSELAPDLGVNGGTVVDADVHKTLHWLRDIGMVRRTRNSADPGPRWQLPPLVKDLLLDRLTSWPPEILSTVNRALAEQLVLGSGRARQPEAARLARSGGHWDLLADIWRDRKIQWRAGRLSEDFAQSFVDLPTSAIEAQPELMTTRELAPAAPRPGWILPIHLPRGESIPPEALAGMPSADAVIGEAVDGVIAARRARRWTTAHGLLTVLDGDLRRRRHRYEAKPTVLAQAYLDLQRGLTQVLSGAEADAVTPLSRAASSHSDGTDLVAAHASAMLELLHRRRSTSPYHAAAWRAKAPSAESGSSGWMRLAQEVSELWATMDRLSPKAVAPAAWDKVGPDDHPDLYPFLAEVRVRWHLTYGDVGDALGRMEALGLVPSTPTPEAATVAPSIQRAYVDALVADGQLNRAESFMKAAGAGDPTQVPWFRVARARLALVLGRHENAVHLARIERRRLDVSVRDRYELRLIEAAAQLELGNEHESVRIFRHIRHALNRLGILHPYATLPRHTLDAMAGEVPVGAAAAWMVRSWVPDSFHYVNLTEREQVVLEQLVNLSAAAQIAARLVVSPNTVKKQLTSLYSKLGVHNRAEALKVAGYLGLMSPDPNRD